MRKHSSKKAQRDHKLEIVIVSLKLMESKNNNKKKIILWKC